MSLFLHVVGARPNFMKAAPVIRALDARRVDQYLVHTGQHYDTAMSGVFFDELRLPRPDVDLGIGSGSHAVQTARIMTAFEPVAQALCPAFVVVYGDVNSTMAASLVASKLSIPVAHVEAGLRSFDNAMPEEINRRVTDLLSDVLLVTAPEGIENLHSEGIPDTRIHFVGNPMIDTLLSNLDRFDSERLISQLGLAVPYAAVTMHRPSNVDDPAAASRTVLMLKQLSELVTVVLPLHPRGRASLASAGLESSERLRVIEPLSYLDFISLVRGAAVVVTDSGGIQEETTVLDVPCLTVRRNTERPITISHGTNRLTEPEHVSALVAGILDGSWRAPTERPPLWDGHASERIANTLTSHAVSAITGDHPD